jgi:hypothetical protein
MEREQLTGIQRFAPLARSKEAQKTLKEQGPQNRGPCRRTVAEN